MAGGKARAELGWRAAAEVGSAKKGSAKFVASGQNSPGGLPWWGRRGVPGIAAAELLLRCRAKRAAAARVCGAARGVDGVQGVRWAV
jgi:hypothetical protein